jgi:hypothetical protein
LKRFERENRGKQGTVGENRRQKGRTKRKGKTEEKGKHSREPERRRKGNKKQS